MNQNISVSHSSGIASFLLSLILKANFLVRLWVLPISITLMQPKACITHMSNYALSNHTANGSSAARWPS